MIPCSPERSKSLISLPFREVLIPYRYGESMKILEGDEIRNVLPHRGSMLLLDRLVTESENSVRGSYTFRGDEWFFDGHYPGNPIVPGAILCEIMAQSACGLFGEEKAGNAAPLLTHINGAEFRKQVKPGDRADTTAVLHARHGVLYRVDCCLYVKETLCASCHLTLYRPRGT